MIEFGILFDIAILITDWKQIIDGFLIDGNVFCDEIGGLLDFSQKEVRSKKGVWRLGRCLNLQRVLELLDGQIILIWLHVGVAEVVMSKIIIGIGFDGSW
jgi:hypothetical protein